MKNQPKVRQITEGTSSEPPVAARSEAAVVTRLTESIRWIAKSKQHSRETRRLVLSLREALAELRRTVDENHRLRYELAVARGKAEPVKTFANEPDLSNLTNRECQTLRLIASGYATKQIAEEFGVAFKTAVTHRTRLMAKLQLHEAASLTRYAIRHGIVQP